MAAIPMTRSILIHFLALFAVCRNCKSENPGGCSSWTKLQISPDTLSSIKYGNFLIEIYEHVNNQKATTTDSQKKYFYSPIALLDHKSAISTYNRVTKQSEMRFRVEMWNDKVEDEVVKHLNEIVGHEIKSNRVRVLPLEKVILVSKRPTADYSLSSQWTNYDKTKTMWFHLSCYDREVCEELADEMRSDPEHFYHFKLLYSLSSQTSQTKQTTITIDSVTSGQMVTTLLQKFRDKKEIFLTANDEKKMLTETVINIRMDTFDDSEVVSPDTESQILNILKDLLVTSRTTIKEQSDKMWDSVFWNEENYRPDKTTKTLNKFINKLDTETQKKLAEMFQKVERQSEIIEKSQDKEHSSSEKWELAKNHSDEPKINLENKERIQHNYDSKSWTNVDRISLQISEKIANDSEHSRRVEDLKDDVLMLLQESRDHVQWDGEKFVPKPVQLSKINLDKFRDSQSFQDRTVRVRYANAELSAPIKFMEHVALAVVNEWEILKDELKDTRELLKTNVMNLAKTNAELSNMKSDLTNTRIDLTSKLEGTKKELVKTKSELEKTMADFSKTVDVVLTQLNSTEKELAEMKVSAGNFSSELKANSQRLGHELTVAEENLRKELKETLYHLETKTTHLNTSITEFSKMPTSCADLQRMGHKINGIFLVKGSKKMEIVYCIFYPNQKDLQKWIGYADVKSEPVHFYVQRNSSFDSKSTPIPFQLERVNEGNAMNLTTGIFTAPRAGIYFFSFMALAMFPASTSSSKLQFRVALNLNGVKIGKGLVDEANTVATQLSPLTLQSTLNLKNGDRVWVESDNMSSGVTLFDNSEKFTHFTGFMLEEEIVSL